MEIPHTKQAEIIRSRPDRKVSPAGNRNKKRSKWSETTKIMGGAERESAGDDRHFWKRLAS